MLPNLQSFLFKEKLLHLWTKIDLHEVFFFRFRCYLFYITQINTQLQHEQLYQKTFGSLLSHVSRANMITLFCCLIPSFHSLTKNMEK